ncbi:three-Cys-motif partner protein TcmP [Pseudazoarcus pumilus]|uniref:three-Cys-motif partner protein TcmP n=1 Tax=Pseudazoarcus pumilus TaxID=2067960 RepID=UPI0013DD428B|nr:three-Cys-motif partner protein TcmP [Pseudazoarcus pumilus]
MDNDFGAEHTTAKLRALGDYLPAYTTALKAQPFRLTYIDAFAGTGECRIKIRGGEKITIPGSATLGHRCDPPFDRLVFIEKHSGFVDDLNRLRASTPEREIDVICGDANVELPRVLARLNPASDRTVIFLDPFGMELDWATLKAVAKSGFADVWYLFPLSGLYRQAAHNSTDVDAGKAARLTRMLGTDRWRVDFYKEPPQMGLFSKPDEVRDFDVQQMTDWVTEHLRSIFPKVMPPKILHQTMPSGVQGAPLYALYFAMANPSYRAHALATRLVTPSLR